MKGRGERGEEGRKEGREEGEERRKEGREGKRGIERRNDIGK